MIEDVYTPDFTKSGKEMLIELINWGNRHTMTKPLEADKVWFTKPKKLSLDNACNTAIRFEKAIGYRGMEYPQDIEYNRIDISQLAKVMGFDGEVALSVGDRNTYSSIHTILADLYKVFKVKLLPEDIVDEYIPVNEIISENPLTITLRVNDNSIAYYGQLELKLIPREIRLDTVVRNMRYEHSFQPPRRYGLS